MHTANAGSVPAHGANVVLVEADSLAIVRSQKHNLLSVSQTCRHQFVALFDVDGDDADGTHMRKLFQLSLLHRAVARGEKDVAAFFLEFAHRQHRSHGLAGLQANKVPDMLAFARGSHVGDFVDLQPIHSPSVSEDQNVGMGRSDKQMLDKITLARLGPLDAPSAAPLRSISVNRHPLDVTLVRDGDDHILLGD